MSTNAIPRQRSPKNSGVQAALRANCAAYVASPLRVALKGPLRHTNQAATAISA